MIFMKLTLSHKAICCGDLSPRRVAATYRLVCPGLKGKIFLSLSKHIEKQLGKPLVSSHFKAKQTSKQINYFCPKRVQMIVT